jgi:uncharacterized protein (TIGR00369 family)
MRFYWDGEQVVSVWKANPNFVSWIDTLHGGIQATLLDEICGWVVFYQLQGSGVTAKMEMRYRKPVSTLWPYIRLNAKLVEQRHNLAIVHGEILNPDGECCAECTCTYFIYTEEKSIEMGYIHTRLADEDVTLQEAILLLGQTP